MHIYSRSLHNPWTVHHPPHDSNQSVTESCAYTEACLHSKQHLQSNQHPLHCCTSHKKSAHAIIANLSQQRNAAESSLSILAYKGGRYRLESRTHQQPHNSNESCRSSLNTCGGCVLLPIITTSCSARPDTHLHCTAAAATLAVTGCVTNSVNPAITS